ncbi:MAG: hypothetical protein WDM78_11020 [Puia sp.]
MEDVSMSINNDRQELSVGLLSTYRNTSLKNVQVFNYSMREGRFDLIHLIILMNRPGISGVKI